MLTKDTLVEIAAKQRKNILNTVKLIPRELIRQINIDTNHAVIISGIRRCGKSTLLNVLMQRFKACNYFNFEDPRLSEFKVHDFEKLTLALKELNGSEVYFFDEIQNVPQWETYIRSLLDQKKKVFLTGSNASLLSRELGTKLTGRNLRYELYPFSFTEYCLFKEKKPDHNVFLDYFNKGGFPEYIRYNEQKILQDIYLDILYRDIISRHKLKNEKSLKEVANFLISNAGKEFSYNSLKKIFSLGTATTPINYVSYLEDSYLLFVISKFDFSLKKQAVNPKKAYVIDNALGDTVASKFTKDQGRMLENIVFLELKKRHETVFYFKRKGECDFITKDKNAVSAVYQVCYELTPDNLDRELGGLIEAVKETKVKTFLILTMNQEDWFEKDGLKIKALPVWKWLLDGKKS